MVVAAGSPIIGSTLKYTKLQSTYSSNTTPVPIASDSGRFRFGFLISPAVNVTLFQASELNSDPTCTAATMVNSPTYTVGPPTPTCTACSVPHPAPAQKLCQPEPKFAAIAIEFFATKPTSTTAASASTFAEVKTFCTAAPIFTPIVFSSVSSVITTIAARFAVFNPISMLPNTIGPTCHGGTCPMCQIQFDALTLGKNTPRNFPNATPTAAIVPVWITRKSVHP